jgi:NhaP-type Na+/H+ or K+/H+ antiporter
VHTPEFANPSFVVAIALAAGIIAQSLARHLRIPGIVILIATGIVLGPDGVGIIRPGLLGTSLHDLVGFAIAVILFEGGLNLEWRRLREQAGTIRRLVTVGALITWVGGAAAARYILGWGWDLSVLFGSLVIVTGPTVITPIVRRVRLKRNLATILEAEGIFIDAVGALVAVVSLEVVLSFSGESLALGFMALPMRLVIGAVVGTAGGFGIALLLRVRGVVPEGLENVFTLCLAWAVFHASNAVSPESGIVAVIVAGAVVGNSRTKVRQELKEFKEQLTVMLIGMLFVLLAADVSVREVLSLGWPGIAVVIALIVLVRPLQVLACTMKGNLTWREKAFMSWLAPRGIVAAAVASLFYERMEAVHVEGGAELRALVFLVIAVTVVVQGGLAGTVARLLNVSRKSNNGYVILGAHGLARVLGDLLRDGGEEVVVIDSNADVCRVAQEKGYRVLNGNALEERTLVAADLDTRRAAVGLSPNDGVNLLFAQKARGEYQVPRAYVATHSGPSSVTPDLVDAEGAEMLFGGEVDVELWLIRVRRKFAVLSHWVYEPAAAAPDDEGEADGSPAEMIVRDQSLILPIALRRGDNVTPFSDRTRPKADDIVSVLLFVEREEDARAHLASLGFAPAPDPL